ncbi:hypothetical protein BB560_000125 [Smittium megazygosporum]|uniref:CoA-binding domain-containing protein n=1 Tax=Smittium megazygosporum TaxID=133381 RepID=A0A2T9ZL88_9FUNG|nr:hypothetical protein BB560_000125 [Smittium megazygosporum]
MPNLQKAFASQKIFGVVGASSDPSKFGNIRGEVIENIESCKSVQEFVNIAKQKYNLDSSKVAISIVTPPRITENTIETASALGIKYFWLQPGSEPADFQDLATKFNVNIIGGGPCVLVSSAI